MRNGDLTNTRLSERLTNMFVNAFHKTPNSDEVDWDFSLVPGPDGQPTLFICFWIRGVILTDMLSMTMIASNPPLMDQEKIDTLVYNAVESLNKERSAKLAANPSVDAEARDVTPGGILLP